MKCQICGEAEATIHYKELKNEEMRELHLCPACAEEKGLRAGADQDKLTLANQFIFMAENLYAEAGSPLAQVQCARCGMQYGEFARLGRLGCDECYTAFSPQLRRIFRRVHGSIRHAGKRPGMEPTQGGPGAKLHRLQEELQRAVASEDFEKAAEIRDQIRTLEKDPTGRR